MTRSWTCYTVDTVTGRIIGTLPYAGTPGWEFGVNLGGQVQVNVPARQLGRGPLALRTMVEPWRTSLVIAWGRYLVQGGPIMTHRWDDASGTLLVGAGGMWALLNRRIIKSSDYDGPITDEAADVVLSGLSLHGLAVRLAQLATGERWGALPIAFPEPEPGTTTRTYYGYDLATVGERLTQLTQLDHGPDVELHPRWSTRPGHVEWELRVGIPHLGVRQPQQGVRYGAGLRRLSVDTDASAMTHDARTPGQGMERAQPVGRAVDLVLPAAGYPLLQSIDRTHTSATELSTLDGHAAATLALHGRPVETWTGVVRVDGSIPGEGRAGVGLGGFGAGDRLTIGVHRHAWIPDGQYVRRAITVSSASSPDEFDVLFAPDVEVP
ncbi:hypothetical protein KCV87_32145 [Actinosynnema pretiosum subsp. pretiosum]|uniref:Minor tail protein n=1 Tax=Actinosynnema pretiosum subsp. pretiosum TaxID=103721 RepID=A0AA45L6X7_9PSEU|nr:hypothetical protein APASM_4710 [Actinosynnema pretiosum subsp. pretiosum]QUF03955.1 hypothetical protein KCV87_32145 [Actinosynnema pretiosum subsp. pretiosum]